MSNSYAGSQRRPRRRIMRAFKIKEISAVDSPAQEGAVALIMKRDDGQAPQTDKATTVAKRAMLTTSEDGHSHLATVDFGNGELTSGETNYVDEHSHPWIRREDGSIVIGEVKGHTHEVAEMGKANKIRMSLGKHTDPTEESMTEKTAAEKTAAEKTAAKDAELDTANKSLDKANKVVALTPETRVHYDGLTEDTAKETFLGKSADEQKTIVEAASKSATDKDPVVFKSKDGTEYRKSDDPRLVTLAKQGDEDRKARLTAERRAEDTDLRKRAEDLKHIPGDVDTRIAILRSVDSISDDAQRTKALDALKAQDDMLAKAFTTHGHGGETLETGSAEQELDTLAKAYAGKNDVTFEVAYAKVCDTEAGRELYAKTIRN